MSVFTVFFCGTGSNSLDAVNTAKYAHGELVSTLAMHHKGSEFVDWIICDGPGSGNLQEDEKWVEPAKYWKWVGGALGWGWEENVRHAMAVIKCEPEHHGLQGLGDAEFTMLKKHGVHPGGFIHATSAAVDRISPQDLQLQKAKIFRKGALPSQVNVIGWSRGGVSCIMLANAMANDPKTAGIPVNIFAVDPVPGPAQFQPERTTVPANVKHFVAVYARDERSVGFAPTVPKVGGKPLILPFPGKHGTVVGNGEISNAEKGQQIYLEPGYLVRDLAEKSLASWGTTLDKPLALKPADIDKHYKQIKAHRTKYEEMHEHCMPKAETDGKKGERFIKIGESGHAGGAFSDAHSDGWEQPKGLSLTDDEVKEVLKTK